MSANEVRGRSPIGANEVRGRSPIGLRYMLYNKNNAFLRKRKEPVGIDLNLLKDDIDVVYDYAIKYEIFAAPKTPPIEVKINTEKFF